MILLINLNRYLGGGETLLIRLARYFKAHNTEYEIVAADGDCWILTEAIRQNLNIVAWPARNVSVIYQSNADRLKLISEIESLYSHHKTLRIFTFCMRDLYNSIYVFSFLSNTTIYHAHGVYHPGDVKYLSSYSASPSKVILYNRRLFSELHARRAILFMNQTGLEESLGEFSYVRQQLVSESVFIPIPIEIDSNVKLKSDRDARSSQIKIICISRFVDFKISAVLGIMRYAASSDNVKLIVIGHGILKFILDIWMFLRKPDNIEILVDVLPNELGIYIDQSDIGFAQGTSILEISKRGLPVIIAPYSRLRDLFKSNFQCLGIFGVTNAKYEFGDLYDMENCETFSISECVNSITSDYEYYQSQSLTRTSIFSADIICERIQNFILGSEYRNHGITLPKAPLLKYFVKKIINIG